MTPEIASLPPGMVTSPGSIAAKAGGMADVTAGLVTALFDLGVDVHVALPNYRRMFHTYEMTLATIEDCGIDSREFWSWLYYDHCPGGYEEALRHSRADLLASGIFAAHFVNTVSPTFLREIVNGWHGSIPEHVRAEFRNKANAGCAAGILNAPPGSFEPATDALVAQRFSPEDHEPGKAANKRAFEEALGLGHAARAPLLFWPSRLDPAQKGCELLTDILHSVISQYWDDGLRVVVVADGPFQRHFHDICEWHHLQSRLVVRDFDERLSHLGYAAADFVLVPSRFEPCGLPQMIGAKYGALPIVHDTGGLHDTVSHLDLAEGSGNGFVFRTYDSNGLRWAIDQAIYFHHLPVAVKRAAVARVMAEAAARFSHAATAERYTKLYERMLARRLTGDAAARHEASAPSGAQIPGQQIRPALYGCQAVNGNRRSRDENGRSQATGEEDGAQSQWQ